MLENMPCDRRTLDQVSRFSLYSATSMSFSPESFFPTVLHAVECHIGISRQGLTQWFSSDLFGPNQGHVEVAPSF
jgi:hypothetical protein